MPKTNYGRWSVGCIVGMFLIFSIRPIVFRVVFNSTPPEGILGRYLMENLLRGGFWAGISAFIIGLGSIFEQKDRGVWVIISTIIGGIATVVFIYLYFFPH